jgi:hypothetical protein
LAAIYKIVSSGPVPVHIGTGLNEAALCFCRLLKEFREDMRVGIPFYHLSPPPRGHAHNTPSLSREAEIECRTKVLQLRLRGFIEKGETDLITQRFPAVKVMVDGEVLDIRVVWNP